MVVLTRSKCGEKQKCSMRADIVVREFKDEVTFQKWISPEEGTLMINIDASFSPNAESFLVGMAIRYHVGMFL